MEDGTNLWGIARAKAAIDAGDHDTLSEWLQNASPGPSIVDELMEHCLLAKQDHLFALLLQAGANPQTFVENGPRSPLNIILQKDKGDVNTLKLILDNVKINRVKRYVNTKDKRGFHPLFLACENGYFECVKILIEKGANVNSLSCFDGLFPLLGASEKGHLEIVKLLLEKGANVNKSTKTGENALFLASKKGHKDCVKELLRYGANVNARTKCNESALMGAVMTRGDHTLEIVKELVAAGIDVTAKDWREESALCHASRYSTEEVAMYLADKIHERNVCNIDTSLQSAVERGHAKLVRQLLANGWNIDRGAQCRRTLLHLGAERGVTDCLAVILESEQANQLDINREGGQFYELTPLHVAIRWSHPRVVELFLKHKADPDLLDQAGCSTLLSCMCTMEPMGRGTSAKLLLRHGCDVNRLVIPKHATSYGYVSMGTKRRTCLAWALCLRELWMARMVWAAGAHAGETIKWAEPFLMPSSNNLVYQDPEYAPTASKRDVVNFIQNVICEPRTLQVLCRMVIRAVAHRPIHQSVLALPLPPNVIDFVNLIELDEIEALNIKEDEKMRDQKYNALELIEDFDLVSTTSGSDESDIDLFM